MKKKLEKFKCYYLPEKNMLDSFVIEAPSKEYADAIAWYRCVYLAGVKVLGMKKIE